MIKEFANTDRVALRAGALAAKLPLTPNQWTALSVVPAIIAFGFAVAGHLITAALLFFLAGLMDGIDGGLARYLKKPTKLGAFIDGVTDRFVDILAVLAFLVIGIPDFILPVSTWVVLGAYFALMPTFIVAYANHRGAVDDPKEKVVWRILHRVEMYAGWCLAILVAAFVPIWGTYLLVLITLLSILTTFQSFGLAIYKSKRLGEKQRE